MVLSHFCHEIDDTVSDHNSDNYSDNDFEIFNDLIHSSGDAATLLDSLSHNDYNKEFQAPSKNLFAVDIPSPPPRYLGTN